MPHKDLHDLNYLSVTFITILSFLGAILNTKRKLKINKEKFKNYDKLKLLTFIISNVLFDALSVGSISIITYIGLIGYGMNEYIAVAIAGFLAKEGTTAIYQLKLVIAEKLHSEALMEELKQEKENK